MTDWRHRPLRDRRAPRVLAVTARAEHVSGPRRRPDWAPERVAVLAQHARSPVPDRSVVTLLGALDGAGYATVLVSAGDPQPGRVCTWAPGQPELPASTTVVRRPNLGHDFGSWAAVLATWPGVARAGRVLLANDSVLGPLGDLTPLLGDFEAGPEPVWGAVGSDQYRPHLQTFLTGYADGILTRPALASFWDDIRIERGKGQIVRYGELALAETLDRAGIRWRAAHRDPGGGANPTLMAAERLLAAGLPFVKANAWGIDAEPLAGAVAGWRRPGAPSQPPATGLARRLAGVRFAVQLEGPLGLARRTVLRHQSDDRPGCRPDR